MTAVICRSPLSRPTKSTIEYPIAPYSFLKTFNIRSLSSASSTCASPSTHVPVGFPILLVGTTRTRGFLRILLTFHAVEEVRT